MAAPPWLSVLRWILLLTISAHGSSVLAFLVTEGSTVILPCHYSVKHHGLSHVCWGRDCGTFWCNDIIIQTDEYGVISKVSDRYKLIGDVLLGQMDLGIQKIQKTDGGPYCCRVDIEGFFNDKKVSYTLRVMKAPTTVPPTTTTPIITEPLETQTVSSLSYQSRGADSSFSDISWQNVTHVHSGAMVAFMGRPLTVGVFQRSHDTLFMKYAQEDQWRRTSTPWNRHKNHLVLFFLNTYTDMYTSCKSLILFISDLKRG
uniref:T cell immunoglobulin and mucin domain containing 4 n=1 Tax=Cyprinus carpio carpio TaxID=630221 RepID=A0A8C1HA34_CYPCA